jgi:hypothetical protein
LSYIFLKSARIFAMQKWKRFEDDVQRNGREIRVREICEKRRRWVGEGMFIEKKLDRDYLSFRVKCFTTDA